MTVNRLGHMIVVGSYNRDLTLEVKCLPGPGETIHSRRSHAAHGGKGSNQAIQAARAGASVEFIGAVGDDAAGRGAKTLWRQNGIAIRAVETLAGTPTGSATILVADGGENCIVVSAQANAGLSEQAVARAASRIAKAALVVAQLETPPSVTRLAFELARRHGAVTVLNAAPTDGQMAPELLALVDILIVNEGEGQALAGVRAEKSDLAQALLPMTAIGVLVSAGADGAYLARHGFDVIHRAAPQISAVDTTGAGDALIGAFTAMLARSGDFEKSLQWGVAAGSLACLVRGAEPSFRGEAEIAAAVAA